MEENRINVGLLEKVKAHILEDERRFNMSRYVERAQGHTAPPCGTVACIAGWAVMLTDGMPEQITNEYYIGVGARAADLLGLNEDEASSLFYYTFWPERFARRYAAAIEDEAEETPARVAADLIDSIIAARRVEVSEDV